MPDQMIWWGGKPWRWRIRLRLTWRSRYGYFRALLVGPVEFGGRTQHLRSAAGLGGATPVTRQP